MCVTSTAFDRCAASIASATLQGFEMVSKDDCLKSLIEVRFEESDRKHVLHFKILQTGCGGGLKRIFFDSRKDKNLSQEMVVDR